MALSAISVLDAPIKLWEGPIRLSRTYSNIWSYQAFRYNHYHVSNSPIKLLYRRSEGPISVLDDSIMLSESQNGSQE